MKNFKYVNYGETTSFLTVPDSMLTYASDTVFNTWQVLETQLSQIDETTNPEMYHALDERAATVFNAWMCFRYTERRT